MRQKGQQSMASHRRGADERAHSKGSCQRSSPEMPHTALPHASMAFGLSLTSFSASADSAFARPPRGGGLGCHGRRSGVLVCPRVGIFALPHVACPTTCVLADHLGSNAVPGASGGDDAEVPGGNGAQFKKVLAELGAHVGDLGSVDSEMAEIDKAFSFPEASESTDDKNATGSQEMSALFNSSFYALENGAEIDDVWNADARVAEALLVDLGDDPNMCQDEGGGDEWEQLGLGEVFGLGAGAADQFFLAPDGLNDEMDDGGMPARHASNGVEPSASMLRPIEAKDLDAQRQIVRRRRRRVASERGEDAARIVTPTSTDWGDAPAAVAKALDNAKRRWNALLPVTSALAASIIPEQSALNPKTCCALTSAAKRLVEELSRAPRSHRPFPALQQAFWMKDNPPCVRCTVRAPAKDLARSKSLCRRCYSKLFVESASTPSLADTDTSGFWSDNDEATAIEAQVTSDARAVAAQLVEKRRAAPTAVRMESESSTDGGRGLSNSGSTGLTKTPTTPGSHGVGSGTPASPPPPTSSPRAVGEIGPNDEWSVRASDRSLRTINPIRNLVQNIDVKPNPAKELIKLSVGDPTLYGNLRVGANAIDKYCDVIRSFEGNGYSMSMGSLEAREAVAQRYSIPEAPLTAEDVVLTAGTSGALEIALGAIANEGDNVLLPEPGFPLFRTIAEGYGVECRYYRLLPGRQWEIELSDLAKVADERTAAIVVNNPSNPCGSVYSATHIQDLLAVASTLKLPIIADEVYADMVFSGQTFTAIASKSVDVPVLSVGGMSKQFVVPGWRLGWILIHDRNGVLDAGSVRKGIRQLTTRMLVPNTPAQAVLPTMLATGTSDVAFRSLMKDLESNAKFTMKALASAAGVQCVEPQGSMYVMAEIDTERLGFEDDMHFTEALLEEEAVFVLPGRCFQAPNFVRIVFCAPQPVLSEAFHRIRAFCSRHSGGM